ncbi:erythrocyte membrane protein 1 [Plasmodium falciparum RAJ116]|uniref:Erythrocyte membrane protein 1 n=1 Tax=Plasmodium falciparum RAJ116 TaxID=580058 RepID=A0A0L0CSB2_PLAFA|nr:erythrocyte membrane protein 1 [Plasmodium falciparum RAJ116]
MGPHGDSRGGGEDKYKNAPDAKYLLDLIGEEVHEEIVGKKTDGTAKKYIEELKGSVSFASILGEESNYTTDPCELIKNEGQKLINGSVASGVTARGDPCGSAGEKRFSKERVAEYDEKKIKDNKGKGGRNEGECAPYRRLSLCNKNFQNMNSKDSSKAKNDLLVDVCLAAHYEGESIKTHYEQYDATYPGSGSTTCTELARSFADIGDIVRGRDLYSGNSKENKQRDDLEKNLKKYFQQIHKEVTSSGNNKEALKARYGSDKDPNYYQLREDWWTANRSTIWEAITCNAQGNTYFRTTCSDERGGAQANDKCRCPKTSGANAGKGSDNVNIVPTYFDYVPQYLRWFEEWAEDFCRKKKKKVENLQKQCRGQFDNEPRYCSRNGYDCEKTKRAIGKLRYGKQCISCLYACNPYVEWIDNQRKQFDKQKNKYDEEITRGGSRSVGRKKRAARSNNNYEGYEKKFYEKLKESDYGKVDKFLEKLSKENVCTQITDEKEGRISFENVNSRGGDGGAASGGTSDTSGTNDKNEGTFYRSEYCQPCPHCGVKKKNGNEWEKKNNENCKNIKLYKPIDDKGGTPITILKSGDEATEIEKKLKEFCQAQNGTGDSNSDPSLYDPWQCYQFDQLEKDQNPEGVEDDDDGNYDGLVKTGGGLCILKKEKKEQEKERSDSKSQKEPDEIQKTFYDFFYYWVAHMLKDSIHWRTKKIKKCLENGNKKCGKKICNGDCDCFLKWVKQKETEWKNIKIHFGKQSDMETETKSDAGVTLAAVLKLEFYKEKSEENSKNSLDEEEAEELKQLSKIIESEDKNQVEDAGAATGTGKKTLMDKLIEHEAQEAEKCKKCDKPPGPESAGRSLPSPPADSDVTSHVDSEEHDEDADEVEEEETAEAEEDGGGETIQQEEGSGPPTQDTEQGPKEEVAPPPPAPAGPTGADSTPLPGPEGGDGVSPPQEIQTDSEKTPEDTDTKDPGQQEQTGPKNKPLSPPARSDEKSPPKPKPPPQVDENPFNNPHVKTALMTSTLAWSVGIGFAAFTYFYLKKKPKSPVDLLRVIDIPKGDYDIPTLKSKNRYIPYKSAQYKGKTYIYMEGDTSGDEDKYAFMSDTTDVTSSESEYEEMDINDIYVPGSPKYKTLIEVVLEPSGKTQSGNNIPSGDINSGDHIPSDNTPTPSPINDDEWNQLKHDFISNMLQNIQPNDYRSGNIPLNTHPTMSRHNIDQKPFIMSIHDRNLYIGQEYSYDMSTNSGENNLYSGENNVYSGIDPTSDNRDPYSDKNDPISDNHHPYSGIDLINDVLNGDYDIYDEILKRKENELFGTNHPKHTNTHNVTKSSNSDPILNQINLFHKWLDRHRNMCEEWDKNKVELLDKLKEEWNKENNNNGDKTYNSDNKPSHNHVLNTDVSIQIDMDNPKPKNEFTNMDTNPDKSTMDTILDDLEKYNEPYYYDFYKDDIIYHDVDVEKSSMDDIYVDHNNVTSNNMDVPTKMHIEMNIVNNKNEIFEEEYPISDIWNI